MQSLRKSSGKKMESAKYFRLSIGFLVIYNAIYSFAIPPVASWISIGLAIASTLSVAFCIAATSFAKKEEERMSKCYINMMAQDIKLRRIEEANQKYLDNIIELSAKIENMEKELSKMTKAE